MESCANIGIVCQVTQAIDSVVHVCIQVISGGSGLGNNPCGGVKEAGWGVEEIEL